LATVDATGAPTGIRKYIPILDWLPAYQGAWLRTDFIAGLTAAAVVIPQAMAYATIAGLPVQVGLYVALTPMLVYALLGTSRRLSVSTTSAISIFTATALMGAVGPASSPEDYIVPAATLAVLVGLFLLLAGILRLGFLANFISQPVLTGLMAGVGVIIIVSQLGKVLGISVSSGSSILETLGIVFTSLGQINWPTAILAAVSLAILILLPRFAPRIPAALVAVALGIALSALFDIGQMGVALVGNIPAGLPSLSLPDLSLMNSLWLPAAGIALLTATESISIGRSFRKFGEPEIDTNQEFLALGLANLAGGLFQAYPASGGASQTEVNDQAGAITQVAALVTVGVVVLILLFLSPLIALMPQATLGAILLLAGRGLINVDEFRSLARFRRMELVWAVVAFVVTIVGGLIAGVLVAVLISILTLIAQVNRPPVRIMGRLPGTVEFRPVDNNPTAETFPGLLIARMEGRLYFANVSYVIDKLWALIHQASPQPQVLLGVADAIPDVEYTAFKSMEELEDQLQETGISLWLAVINPDVMTLVERTPLGKKLGNDRLFGSLEEAVEAYLQSHKPENTEDDTL
jgi:SulP family sulfate permease